jgi:HD-GYP domain-containing protein (c-di-GMP phosphodiesterase class II)
MDKIVEALSKLLPQDKLGPVSEAIKKDLVEAKKELEAEYNQKLQEAYAQVSSELKSEETKAEQGYAEAYQIIQDLRNRLETQKIEFEQALEEGYEEAYQMLLSERGKNENIEVDMYETYDKKLAEMKDYMIDKVDQFLQYKGHEIYEQARRDLVNDPRTVEHRVALDKIVDVVSDYISDDDFSAVTNSKLEETRHKVEELEGHKRILEARNIRLSTEINKLNESLRQAQGVVTEATQHVKKERVEQAKNVMGRGKIVTEGIIAEYNSEPVAAPEVAQDTTLVEGNEEFFRQMQVLSGLKNDA